LALQVTFSSPVILGDHPADLLAIALHPADTLVAVSAFASTCGASVFPCDAYTFTLALTPRLHQYVNVSVAFLASGATQEGVQPPVLASGASLVFVYGE
jgi:hypothetical protein